MIETNKKNPFQNFVGIKLEKVDEKGSLLSLKLKAKHFNLYGIPHGGIHSTLLDISMGIAGSYSMKEHESISTITLNLNINFVRQAKERDLFAKGFITRRTQKLAFCEGVVADMNDNILAKGTGVFKLIRD